MSAAIHSVFTASVALASLGVIAVSQVAPAPEVHLPTVQIPGIELTAAPALGAIPYQILVNLLGDGLAVAPIIIGGTGQCQVCIGPVSPPSPAASPFTGWGALGFAAGLLNSPFAIVGALQAGQSITQALGVGVLAFQIPADSHRGCPECGRCCDLVRAGRRPVQPAGHNHQGHRFAPDPPGRDAIDRLVRVDR